eukprot:166990-Prymnesium_polylepis.1
MPRLPSRGIGPRRCVQASVALSAPTTKSARTTHNRDVLQFHTLHAGMRIRPSPELRCSTIPAATGRPSVTLAS